MISFKKCFHDEYFQQYGDITKTGMGGMITKLDYI